jgi:DNA-directed RNA polymerase specialized sigma24 family protein
LIVTVHLSAAEVAQQSGLSEADIKTLFDSAREKLRKRAFETLRKSEHSQIM